MSSYSKIVLSFIIIIFLSSCTKKIYTKTKNDSSFKDNVLISLALEYEFSKNYKQSKIIYEKLYENNPNSYEYLEKLILLNRYLNNNKDVQNLCLNNMNKYKDKKEILLQEYIMASVKLKQYEHSLQKSKELIKEFNNSKNNTIIANIYHMKEDFKNAVKYYDIVYKKNNSTKILLVLSNILFNKLNERTNAINYLLEHNKVNKCEHDVCIALLRYYDFEQNYEAMINIANTLYKKYKDSHDRNKVIKIQNLIVELYLKIDINKAIKFLEDNRYDNQKLLNLYSINKQYKKAILLTKKIYSKTKNDSLLGQIAILNYELSNKVNSIIIDNFEKSLKYKSNDTYENYYGYILIDHNINIKKGLDLIKKAYEKFPNNLAYKDSMAYAYYKNNNCQRAYILMDEIVKKVGLDNSDIKRHWEEIKNCYNKNKEKN